MTRPLPPASAGPLRPRDPAKIGPYRLVNRLGTGGMGVAYLAESSNRDWVVIKTVREDLSDDEDFLQRLARELAALRAVSGSGSVRVYGEDLQASPPWFAMEFVPGLSLAELISTHGPLTNEPASRFALDLAQSIRDIQSVGVVHRDLKPANIIMSSAGPRIIDFGIADLLGSTRVTSTGQVAGTMGWLAPEQLKGEVPGSPVDVHAWALCVLFAMTGSNPFASKTSSIDMYSLVHVTPEIPSFTPPALRRALDQALVKEPAHRADIATVIRILKDPESSLDKTRVGDFRGGTSVPTPTTGGERGPKWRVWIPSGAAALAAGLVAGLVITRGISGG